MVSGFKNADDFKPVIGWELYQVTIDKYHVMFFFENGWQLLNVAHAFSHKSADGKTAYTYEIYGAHKHIAIDGILRKRIAQVKVHDASHLALMFENGDVLTVHDAPELRSWWFMPIADPEYPEKAQTWAISDEEIY